jgi:predicted metal-dependent phosphoesterase TrpH
MFRVDLHSHTRFFHSFPGQPTPFDPVGARLLALFGRRQGLDGVALTNHDYCPDVGNPGRIQFLPGVEITTTDGHILVVGPDPPTRTPPGELTPEEAVADAHDRGCAAIIAHPFRAGSVRESRADFDAVEINGKHPARIDRVRTLADALDLPLVAGSDAHFPFEVGRASTRIDIDRLTPESAVAAIRDGRVEPRIRNNQLDGLLRTVYRHVHQYWR